MRCYQSLLILGPGLLMMISLSQGKQDVINSKIHYLSLNPEEANGPISRSNLNNYKNRLKLNSGIKESNKIDIDVKFINNGRPFRINSKRSKLLRNLNRRKGVLLRQRSGPNHQVTIKTIKHLKNKTAQSEKAKHSSHESGNSDEDSLSDKRVNVKSLLLNERGKVEAALLKEFELERNQGKEFTRVTSTDPGISVSQNRADTKSAMSWIKNRDESEINADITTNEVTNLHDSVSDSVNIREKDAPHHQIVPASTMKLSYPEEPKIFRKPVVSGYSTFPHLNTPYSVSSKRKLKEKTHFTEINRHRVNQSSSSARWIPFHVTRREMAGAPLNLSVRPWLGGHFSSRMTLVTSLPSFLHQFAVSPTFGRHRHLVSGPALSRHTTGPLPHTPYFAVQNRNGPVIQHFPLYG